MRLRNRTFGATPIQVSELGLGGAFLDQVSFDQGVAAVRRAVELGVCYFDTSPGYCNNQSQLVMGEGLAGVTRPHMLATKVGYFENLTDHRSEEAILDQIHDNLQRLRRSHVDVLQIHEADMACWWRDDAKKWQRLNLTDDVSELTQAPVWRAMMRAKREGLCRFVGITGNDEPTMTWLLERLPVDAFLLAFHYDLLHRGAVLRAWPLAKSKQAAIVLGGILQCGRLVEPHDEWLSERPGWMSASEQRGYEKLLKIQGESGLSLVELSVRFVLNHAGPSVVLVGAATPGQVDELVGYAGAGVLPGALYERVVALVEETR